MEPILKLSLPASGEFWKISVLHEDEAVLAIDKPMGLLVSPDRHDPDRPNLMKLLHRAIEVGAPWARERGIVYLANAHRLDFETTGVLLLAKSKTALTQLANQFGSEAVQKNYLALAHGSPPEDQFEINVKLGPHPFKIGVMRPDPKRGKRCRTSFTVLERFRPAALIVCHPWTGRTHQIRAHLRAAGFPLVGDALYGGKPLLLSQLKRHYRLKEGAEEKPLIQRAALHAESISFAHPGTGETLTVRAPWPKDLRVAVKFLRRYAT